MHFIGRGILALRPHGTYVPLRRKYRQGRPVARGARARRSRHRALLTALTHLHQHTQPLHPMWKKGTATRGLRPPVHLFPCGRAMSPLTLAGCGGTPRATSYCIDRHSSLTPPMHDGRSRLASLPAASRVKTWTSLVPCRRRTHPMPQASQRCLIAYGASPYSQAHPVGTIHNGAIQRGRRRMTRPAYPIGTHHPRNRLKCASRLHQGDLRQRDEPFTRERPHPPHRHIKDHLRPPCLPPPLSQPRRPPTTSQHPQWCR